MPVQLVNPDPRCADVHLIDPAPLGYLHLAANVEAAHRPDTTRPGSGRNVAAGSYRDTSAAKSPAAR